MASAELLRPRRIDIATAIGIIAAAALVMLAIFLSGTPYAFLDLPAMLIVIGGTAAVTTASFTIPDIWRAQKLIPRTVVHRKFNPTEVAEYLIDLAREARKNTVLALQNHLAAGKAEHFLDKGLGMVIDNEPVEKVAALLEQDIDSLLDRHGRSVAIFRKAAEIAPAMGLIGTLIGLVQMLANLDDPNKIGPAMAVALLTTLYGAMLSYMVFSPLATKLEHNTSEEILIRRLYMTAIISMARQENPRQLEAAINTILPPANRIRMFD